MAKLEIRDEATGELLLEGSDKKLMLKELRLFQKKYRHLKYLVNGETKMSIASNF